jgi:hypothetical protein
MYHSFNFFSFLWILAWKLEYHYKEIFRFSHAHLICKGWSTALIKLVVIINIQKNLIFEILFGFGLSRMEIKAKLVAKTCLMSGESTFKQRLILFNESYLFI